MMMNIENEVKRFAYDFMDMMKWDHIPINRVKISQMQRYKGLCISPDCETIYIILSELTNRDNKDFFATLIHELIHAHLLINKNKYLIAHKHGKAFKRWGKKVEKKTNSLYSAKEIIK